MKIGYARWLGKALTITLFAGLTLPVFAQSLTWSDRISKETSDGSIIETPPFVKIDSLAFSRFSDMQTIAFVKTLRLVENEENLHVFKVWQGGASQGEQLMLLSVSNKGIDVIGPHDQDFETMDIQSQDEAGRIFFLLKNDTDQILTRLTYFSGVLVETQ